MYLHSVTLWATGPQRDRTAADHLLVLPTLGLLAIGDATRDGPDARGGIRIALDTLRAHIERHDDILQRFRRNPSDALRERVLDIIGEAFTRAAQELFAFARRREGIEITLDLALLLEHEAFIGHVGEGRIYLVRRGLVHQLTVDHSAELTHPAPVSARGPHQPSRALGPEPRVQVESMCIELSPDDRFLLCTSDLHRSLPESLLHARLTTEALSDLAGALEKDVGSARLIAIAAQLGSTEAPAPDSAWRLLEILAPMPLFAHCTERELRVVAQATRPHPAAAGTVLFEEGEPGTALYLLIHGEVQITRQGKPIASFGPGCVFGEMAMLDAPSRSATATARTDCELLVIPREAFFAMLQAHPMLAVKILWNMLLGLSHSLRQTSARLTELGAPED